MHLQVYLHYLFVTLFFISAIRRASSGVSSLSVCYFVFYIGCTTCIFRRIFIICLFFVFFISAIRRVSAGVSACYFGYLFLFINFKTCVFYFARLLLFTNLKTCIVIDSSATLFLFTGFKVFIHCVFVTLFIFLYLPVSRHFLFFVLKGTLHSK